MTAISIGARRVEFYEHFICYDGEDVELPADVEGVITKVVVRFEVDQPGGEPRVDYAFGDEGTLRIVIRNWNNPIGQSLNEPQRFGSFGDDGAFLALASKRTGSMNSADVMILIGP